MVDFIRITHIINFLQQGNDKMQSWAGGTCLIQLAEKEEDQNSLSTLVFALGRGQMLLSADL